MKVLVACECSQIIARAMSFQWSEDPVYSIFH